MRRRTLAWILGGIGILVLAGVAIVMWATFSAPVDTPLLGNLRYECTLAASEADLSVTIKGPFSGHECGRLMTQTDLLPVQLEPTNDTPSEPIICTFSHQRTTITVRGPSLLKIAQSTFCSLVKDVATSSAIDSLQPAPSTIVDTRLHAVILARPHPSRAA